MPQAQVIQLERDEPPRTAIPEFFSKLAGSYKEQNDKVEMDRLLSQYQQNRQDVNAWEDLQIGLEKSNISPTRRLEAQGRLNEQKKILIERDKALNTEAQKHAAAESKQLKEKALIKEKKRIETEKNAKEIAKATKLENETEAILLNGGESPEEAKRLSKILSPASATARTKAENRPEQILNEKLAGEAAKEIHENEKTISESKSILTNIDEVQRLAEKELRGPKAYLKAAFNTESAAQVKTLSATNLKSVIKLFNPVGALPTQKLNWIRDTFAISPWDNVSSITGKLNTQKIIANQAVSRAKERNALLRKYNGNIPTEVSDEFDKNTESLVDALHESLAPEKEEKKKEERPGFVKIKDPQGVERWVPENIAKQLQGAQ